MAFLRFVVATRHPDSGVDAGVFTVAYALRDRTDVDAEHRGSLEEHLSWFDKNLAKPDRFNRSRSKGHWRRDPRGIAWFRDTATECISRMHELTGILEIYGHSVRMIQEDRVGYVVYEDKSQVVAEPFADTRTRGD